MKKLLCMTMLLNFTPIALGSENDINKEIAYNLLSNAANGVKGTIKAAIPFCTVACLSNEACKATDSKKLDNMKDKFLITCCKSLCAIPAFLMTCGYSAPKANTFFGVHALSLIPAIVGYSFACEKYEYLYKKEKIEKNKK